MKRIIIAVFSSVFIVIFGMIPTTAYANDLSSEESEISGQVDDILSDYEIDYSFGEINDISFSELIEKIKESISGRLLAPVRVLGTLLIVIVFTAFLQSAGESFLARDSSSNIYNMICVMTAVTIITPQLFTVYERASNAIERSGGFLLVFVPIFAGITIAAGGITTGGVYNMLILGASEFIVALSRSFLLPIVSIITVLSVTGSVFPKGSINSLANLLKKFVTWGMTVAVTLFTGFITLKCTITGKADGVVTKTAKYVISGFIPVIGGAVSDAYTTVKSSFSVISCTAGAAGVIGIVMLMLPPILEVMIFRGVMWIGTAAADMLSAESLSKLMKGIDCGLAIAQSVLICYSMLFILCTAILMQSLS